MPLVFTDAPAGRVVARTDWSPHATMFDYRGSWITLNHTGLAPGTGYTAVAHGGQVTITLGGSDATTDGAGVLRVVF